MANQEPLRLRLSEAMALNGLTQTDVSQPVNITQSTLSRFLRGNSISPDSAQKIENWLDGMTNPVLPDNSEVRAAIRLFRYMTQVVEEGGTLVIKYPDGKEQALLLLF